MDCPTNPQCQEVADKAVKRVFAILGVDVDDPREVEEFREDLRFGKRLRKYSDYGTMAIVAAVCVAIAAALWAGVISKLGIK
jgi:hypothetical protein